MEDFSPIYVGDTGAQFAPVFLHADESPVNLSGATLSMRMENQLGTIKVCSGSWIIDDALNGKAHYSWQASDIDTAGTWTLQVVITIGGNPLHADPRILEIRLPI